MVADKAKVEKILVALEAIPDSAWVHDHTTLTLGRDGDLPKCGFCVGDIVAYTFGKIRTDAHGDLYIYYGDGRDILADALGLPIYGLGDGKSRELFQGLSDHGAGESPFSSNSWEIAPHTVVRNLAIELGIIKEA